MEKANYLDISRNKNGYTVSNGDSNESRRSLQQLHVFANFDSMVAHLRTQFGEESVNAATRAEPDRIQQIAQSLQNLTGSINNSLQQFADRLTALEQVNARRAKKAKRK